MNSGRNITLEARLKEVVKAEEGEIYDIELDADLLKANEEMSVFLAVAQKFLPNVKLR